MKKLFSFTCFPLSVSKSVALRVQHLGVICIEIERPVFADYQQEPSLTDVTPLAEACTAWYNTKAWYIANTKMVKIRYDVAVGYGSQGTAKYRSTTRFLVPFSSFQQNP